MNWFTAKIIYQIVDEESISCQYDEQVRLLRAINREQAFEMAHQVALMNQDKLTTESGKTINWEFVAVTELKVIGQIENGLEIQSVINETDSQENYLELVKQKADFLKNRLFFADVKTV